MLKIELPAIKSNNGFDVHIARYPILEESKLKFYIYLTGIESTLDKDSLEKFKKYCIKIIEQLDQKKLVEFLQKNKKYIIINPCIDNDGIIKIINKQFLEDVGNSDYYVV